MFQPETFDIAKLLDNDEICLKNLENCDKVNILENKLVPEKLFSYPYTKEGKQQRKFNEDWIKDFPCLAYSKSKDGIYCKVCLIFCSNGSGKGGHQKLGRFVRTPYRTWQTAREKLKAHAALEYHTNNQAISDDFCDVINNKKQNIVDILDSNLEKIRSNNRAGLIPIIKTVLFCGEQELSLRGNNDSGPLSLDQPTENDGNFRALLRFRVDAGDEKLKNHILKCQKNASYISPEIQNEIIEISAHIVQEKIVKTVNESEHFSILADETMDVSSKEQLTLNVRYVTFELRKPTLREDFLCFVRVTSQKSEELANVIVQTCEKLGLNLHKCIGQGYDGAANMAGHVSGVQVRIKELYPKMMYVHCSSHRLNLSISYSMKSAIVANSLTLVEDISRLFRKNDHPNQLLEAAIKLYSPHSTKNRLINACKTRFVERHETIHLFVELFECICICLDEIKNDTKRVIAPKAAAFLAAMEKSEFIISILICNRLLSLTLPLSIMLQEPTIDLVEALRKVEDVIEAVEAIRENADTEFQKIFETAKKMSKDYFDVEIKAPRTNFRQRHRENHQAESAEQYFRVSSFIPCVESLRDSLKSRFTENSEILSAFQLLLPKNAKFEKFEELKNLSIYYGEFCGETALEGEYTLWCQYSKRFSKKSMEVLEVLENCNINQYLNIHRLLKILASLPVTTCTAERSLSTMKRIKTIPRNRTGDNRLSNLAVLSAHRKIKVDPIQVLDRMAQKKRKLLL